MGSVAERLVGGVLAPAKIDGLRFGGFELDGRETAASVGAIAEWLVGTLAAGAPGVAFSSFNFNGIGTFLCNRCFRHWGNFLLFRL